MLKVASFMPLQRPLCDANHESKSLVSLLLHYTELQSPEYIDINVRLEII